MRQSSIERPLAVFSYRSVEGDFRIARRGGRWFIECNGDTFGAFDSAAKAALALAECDLAWPGALDAPADIRDWTRGDLTRRAPAT